MRKESVKMVARRMRVLGSALAVFGSVACAGPEDRGYRVALERQAAEAGNVLLSDEFALDRPRLVTPTPLYGDAAFGAETFLVAQLEQHWTPYTSVYDLAVLRFDRKGNALDLPTLPISQLHRRYSPPHIVFTGATFLVIWADEDDLRCARITETGELLEPGVVSSGLTAYELTAAAFDGTNLLAILGTHAARIDTDCVPVGTPVTLPSTAGARRTSHGATFDGTRHWTLYTEELVGVPDQLSIQAVSTANLALGAPLVVATAPWTRAAWSEPRAFSASIAEQAGKAVVGFSEIQAPLAPFQVTLNYATLGAPGTLDGHLETDELTLVAPRAGFAGDGFLFLDSSPASPLVKLHADGSLLQGSSSGVTDPSLYAVHFANDGTNVLVARRGTFEPLLSGESDVTRGELLDANLAPLGPKSPLGSTATRHGDVGVAQARSTSLSIWTEEINAPRVFASRRSSAGVVLDPVPLEIPIDGNDPGLNARPVVTSNGTDFLVAWGQVGVGNGLTARVSGQLVSETGALNGPSFVVHEGVGASSLPYGYAPTVASDGTGYLAAWIHAYVGRPAPSILEVRAARISRDGMVLDVPPLVLRSFSLNAAPSPGYSGQVAVAHDGTSYVVASSVYDAQLLGPAPLELQRVPSSGAPMPAVVTPWEGEVGTMVSNGARTFVTLRTPRGDPGAGVDSDGVLRVGRFDTKLTVLDDAGILVTDTAARFSRDRRSSVAWDGATFWVSWKDDRRNVEASDDLYVARVTPDGEVLDRSGVLLSTAVPDDRLPVPGAEFGGAGVQLASGDGRVLAAYTRYDPTHGVRSFMLHGRYLESVASSGGTGGEGGAIGEAGVSGTGGTGGEGGRRDPGGVNDGGTAGEEQREGEGGIDTGSGADTGDSGRTGAGGRGSRAGSGGNGSSDEAGRGGTQPAHPSGPPNDGGCSCRMGRSDQPAFAALPWLLSSMLLLVRRRRRARPGAAPSAGRRCGWAPSGAALGGRNKT